MTPQTLAREYSKSRARRLKRDAAEWYPQANTWAHETARKHDVSPTLAVDLVAVLSPGTRWDVNKFDAEQVLRYGRKHTPATWPAGKTKAYALLEGYAFEDLVSERTSPKVWNFRNNIADPTRAEYVTIDRWIARAAGFPERVHYGRYQTLATLYRDAASILGIVTCTLQAFVWLKTRNEYRFGPQEEIPF